MSAGGGEREISIGTPTLNTWQEISVNVDDMVNSVGGPTSGNGLKLDVVSTGLVLFPPFGMTAGVSYQLDNVRWEGP